MLNRTLRTRGRTRCFLSGVFCLGLSVWGCLSSLSACADRVILSPLGDTLPVNSVKAEFVTGTNGLLGDLSWFAVSSSSGIELEMQRLERSTEARKRYSLNI